MCEWSWNVVGVLFVVLIGLFIIMMIIGVLRIIYEIIAEWFEL